MPTERDIEDSDERSMRKLDHDRLVILEERVRQWQRSTEKRLASMAQVLMWLLAACGSGAVTLVVTLLLGGTKGG